MDIDEALRSARDRRPEHLETLFEILRQPSISTQGVGVRDCAELLAGVLERHGVRSRLIETAGEPVVFGEAAASSPSAPTVIFYGHYDVQPPEPLEAWTSPPFEPEMRNDRIYARGVADNKGQHLCHVLALDALVRTVGPLPLNVKFVLEGEEETGSPNLDAFVSEHADLLQTDLVLTSDGGFHQSGRPIVCFGVRGMLGVELRIRTASRDVHSGNFGNTVPDPTWRLLEVLDSLRDSSGRVAVDGFYDEVRAPTPDELAMGAELPFESELYAAELGLREPVVRSSEEYAHAVMFSPTMTITGIESGYTGPGMKTIVPACASVKLDFRLVADQDPTAIFDKIAGHVEAIAPEVEIGHLGAMRPSRTPFDDPFANIVVNAVKRARNADPLVVPALGGSLPDAVWTKTLGVPSVLVPYAAHDAANHAPDENMRVADFYAGIETSVHLLAALVDR